jgi:hypothetical protein
MLAENRVPISDNMDALEEYDRHTSPIGCQGQGKWKLGHQRQVVPDFAA